MSERPNENEDEDEQTQYGGDEDIDAVEQTESNPINPDVEGGGAEGGDDEEDVEKDLDEATGEDDVEKNPDEVSGEDDVDEDLEEEWTETEHENPDDHEE